MRKVLAPHDFILTKENFLFLVKNYEEFDGYIIGAPKYIPYRLARIKFRGKTWWMLGKRWSRINNPLDSTSFIPRNITSYFKNYKQTRNGFKIERLDIKEIFRAKEGVKKLLYEKDKGNQAIKSNSKIRATTKTLVNLLKEVVPENRLGLTGSSLFGGEMDDFSDIDLVIYGSKNYTKAINHLKRQTKINVHFRTIKEWEDFYERYNVNCCLNKHEFAIHMIEKGDQILVENIPVTIFAVREYPKDFKIFSHYLGNNPRPLERITAEGVIIDDSESMFLPANYLIKLDERREIGIYTDNRAFISQARTGEKVIVSGLLMKGMHNKWIYVDREGYIKKVNNFKESPRLVARNIAFSYPFLYSERKKRKPMLKIRKATLSTIFDPENMMLYELNESARIIYELVNKGVTKKVIYNKLQEKHPALEKKDIQNFIKLLNFKNLVR